MPDTRSLRQAALAAGATQQDEQAKKVADMEARYARKVVEEFEAAVGLHLVYRGKRTLVHGYRSYGVADEREFYQFTCDDIGIWRATGYDYIEVLCSRCNTPYAELIHTPKFFTQGGGTDTDELRIERQERFIAAVGLVLTQPPEKRICPTCKQGIPAHCPTCGRSNR